MEPFILCICPTYKRPAFLANVLACYLRQTWPLTRRHLLICDDAGQFTPQENAAEGWSLFAPPARYPNLPTKFNALVAEALDRKLAPDLVAIWEDDDLYLPGHLSAIAETHARGGEFFTHQQIWSTYKEPRGSVHLGKPGFLFHGSWAFTAGLFQRVGGYPQVDRLDFDQRMGALLRKHGKHALIEQPVPSYVYRWGGVPFHGSQQSGDRFPEHWKALEKRPAPWIGALSSCFDDEAKAIFKQVAQLEP
jgi:hypothetical protein